MQMKIGRVQINLDVMIIKILDGTLFMFGGFIAICIAILVLKLIVWAV